MPRTTITPNHFVTVRYDVPRRGIDIAVHADSAINIYCVPVTEYHRWEQGKRFEGSSFQRRANLDMQIIGSPEFEKDWYLILENFSDSPVNVEYDVFDHYTVGPNMLHYS